MGGLNSCCIPRRNCDCGMNGVTSTPKVKGHRRNLSATFNMSVIDDAKKNCLINVNTATEEELMTLPGINREIAKNIIDYRHHIGGFKCVEDVALSSGVGAGRLSLIRSDLFSEPATLDESTRSQIQSSSSASGNSSLMPDILVNINTANIFTLLKLKGIGMTTAKNIVAYRDKNGKFSSADELVQVKGIGLLTLDQVRSHIILEDYSHQNGKPTTNTMNGPMFCDKENNRKSTSSLQDLLEILGPLTKVPERPDIEKVVLKHKRKTVFRVASWNLERFTIDKAKNPGARDIICMTILENGFGLVAVQELADKEALKEICKELNMPTLPNVKRWQGRRGQWKCVVSEAAGRMFQSMEYLGFLYDSSQKIEVVQNCLLQKANEKDNLFARMPYLGIFKVNKAFDFVLVNVHLKATGMNNRDVSRTQQEVDTMDEVVKAVQAKIKDEQDVVILGDFNLTPRETAFDELRSQGYSNCIASNMFTNISNSNKMGSRSYDNIWINKHTQSVYSGVSGVVREGLFSHWIPYQWKWGGVVSDHCPIYTQLYSNTDMDDGDVSVDDDVNFVVGAIQSNYDLEQ